jgi:glycosyltransferase involved in cell wall biosynthesis
MSSFDTPLVSVVIPTYNRGRVIGRTIDDVLQQTYRSIEVIVVDDGSTDDTHARLAKYGKRIRVLSQKNSGPGAARNRGIQDANGEIIAFQDSDDLWHPTKIERQVALLRKLGLSVPCCVCNAIFRLREGPDQLTFDISVLRTSHEQGLWLNPADVLATRFLFFNQAAVIRREALLRVGGFNPELRYLEDWELALKLALLGQPWAFIREPLAYWHEGSIDSLTSESEHGSAIPATQCAIRVLEEGLRLAKHNTDARLRINLQRRLRLQQGNLRALQVLQMRFWGAGTLGQVLLRFERYRRAIDRRLPTFPKMQTEAVI